MPSHIQAPVLSEFAKQWPAVTRAIWCEEVHSSRRAMGWSEIDVSPMVQTTLPEDHAAAALELLSSERDAIHIFSGLNAYEPIVAAFRAARRVGVRRIGLMMESGIEWGLAGKLRPMRARWNARAYLPHVQMVLAMGKAGVDFYRQAGFAEDALFPFLYQSPTPQQFPETSHNEVVRLVYVGQFVRRKGVDLLLRSLCGLTHLKWQLTLIGHGKGEAILRRFTNQTGLQDRIHWHGVAPSDEIPGLLARHDLCIVPSRFDGWGVATNEAICAGIPVICSDRAASCELIEHSNAGAIFRSGDHRDLAQKIEDFLASRTELNAAKANAARYRSRLRPSVIADYLSRVLRHCYCDDSERPTPPWATQC